jgi:hypothetical protein
MLQCNWIPIPFTKSAKADSNTNREERKTAEYLPWRPTKKHPARAVDDDEHKETGQFTSIFVVEGMIHLQRGDKRGR